MEKHIPLSMREEYHPSLFTGFLWWLSTAEKELLADAVIDRNRYRIIGMTVLATWCFATLAWTYFFSTVTHNGWLAWPLGFFMGFIILTIDRALIKGINRINKNKWWPLLFRAALAITIGTFMAQPALLYMFKKEIRLQTATDNEKKMIGNTRILDSMYKDQKQALLTQKNTLQTELAQEYASVSAARENFLAEADGSGGTGKVGIKDIALAKKKEYEKLDADYRQRATETEPGIAAIDSTLKAIDTKMAAAQRDYAQQFNDGFLTQVEALNNLIKQNSALQFRYYLLVAILLLIELMPVIAKTLLPAGTYDEKVLLREELEKEMAQANIRREQELKELYNTIALQHDKEAITAFFDLTKTHRDEKMRSFSEKWKNGHHQSFDGLWEKMKKEVLSRQEN